MNNLKAERTLTAEELQKLQEDANDLIGFYGRRTTMTMDAETVKAMASMALLSLSTQQPMGEVVAWSDVRDFISHRAEQLKGSIPRQVFWALADDMSNKLRGISALHPNQESGE